MMLMLLLLRLWNVFTVPRGRNGASLRRTRQGVYPHSVDAASRNTTRDATNATRATDNAAAGAFGRV